MKIGLWAGTMACLLMPLSVAARPVPSRQAAMANGVKTTFSTGTGSKTVYGTPIVLTFDKADSGKMLELAVDSPRPVTIELWTGEIAKGATSWDRGRQFLGNSGKDLSKTATFKWMIEPGTYTALVLATATGDEKPEPFYITYGKEVRVPTAQDKAEWDAAMANYNLATIRAAQAKRPVAPAFSGFDINKNPVSMQALKGKIVLLYFWSGTDQGAKDETAYLQDMYLTKKVKGFQIIGLGLDSDQSAFDSVVNDVAPTFPEVYDSQSGNEEIANKYGIQNAGETVLIDGTGHIVSRNLHGDRLSRTIDKVIAENDQLKDALQKTADLEDKQAAEGKTSDDKAADSTK